MGQEKNLSLIHIYLANIENQGAIPSLPVMIQLIKVCGLPVERYFNPEIMREESCLLYTSRTTNPTCLFHQNYPVT